MPETWLPSEPPPPPPRSRARRVVVLWAALAMLFAIVYAVVDSPNDGHATGSDGVAASLWWIGPLCLACVALPTALFVWLFGTSRRFTTQQISAFEAASDGQHARAAQLFGDLARRFRTKPNVWSVAAYNQAHAMVRAGDAAAAIGVLLGVERWPSLPLDGIRRLTALELARAFAIGGDVDKAQRWLDTGRARRATFSDPGQEYAQLADVEGLLLCRAGKFEDALRHYDQTWQRLQSRLTVHNMRAAWLLRAFATASAGTPRDAAAAETWLRLVRATHPGSLAWLTAHWPELAAFAAAHDLGDAPMRATASAGS